MRWQRGASCVVAILVCGMSSRAEDRLGVGVKAGTLGLGVELTGRVNDWFALRGSLNQYNYSNGLDEAGNHYDGDLKLGGYGVLADFYPLKGRFRLTGGLLINRNRIDMTSAPTSNVTIGDNTYTPQEVGTLSGKVRFRSAAPYLGIGTGNAAKGPRRVGFVFDLGALLQGRGDVTLSSSNGQVSSSDLRKEESQVEDDIKSYRLWPVIALGISFRL